MNLTSNKKPYNRDFYLMILGQIVSILGSSLLRFALSLYVLDLTGRADLFATLFAISNIPLLLTPLGGAIADRFNRRNLMVIYDFISSFIVLVLFILMSAGNLSVILIGTVMVLLSFISAMYTPAVNASIPLLVPENKIESANGIVMAVQSLSAVAAPILGGLLYSWVGVGTLIFTSCLAFCLSAVMEIFIRIPFVKREQEEHIIPTIAKDLKFGFVYVIQQSFILKSIILAVLLNLILSPILLVGAPIIFRVTMQSTDTMYGVGMGLINFASVLGALTVGIFTKRLGMNTVYRWLIATAVLLLPMALSVAPLTLNLGYYPSFALFMLGIIPLAMILTILSIFVISKVQKITPNEHLGKVMAIIIAVAQCAAPLGQVMYGVVFEAFQSNLFIPILLVSAALLMLSGVAWLYFNSFQDDCL